MVLLDLGEGKSSAAASYSAVSFSLAKLSYVFERPIWTVEIDVSITHLTTITGVFGYEINYLIFLHWPMLPSENAART